MPKRGAPGLIRHAHVLMSTTLREIKRRDFTETGSEDSSVIREKNGAEEGEKLSSHRPPPRRRLRWWRRCWRRRYSERGKAGWVQRRRRR